MSGFAKGDRLRAIFHPSNGVARFPVFGVVPAESINVSQKRLNPFIGFLGESRKGLFCKSLIFLRKLERAKGFEPSTPTLARFGSMKFPF